MVVVIVTPAEILEGTVNPDLIDLGSTEAGLLQIAKYEKIVASKVRAKINSEQFKKEDGTYDIPEDLKLATISLIDSFYSYSVQWGANNGTKKVTSVKIDDFSENYSENASAFMYFGIPTDGDILDILKKYMEAREWGFWEINLH